MTKVQQINSLATAGIFLGLALLIAGWWIDAGNSPAIEANQPQTCQPATPFSVDPEEIEGDEAKVLRSSPPIGLGWVDLDTGKMI
jgi:hypothetical protein